LQPGDTRTFSLAVELFKPAEVRESQPQPADAAQRAGADPKSPELRAPGRPGLPPPRPATPLADGKAAGARPPGTAAPASTPAKWPAAPSTAPSTATSGRYPAAAVPAPAAGKAPSAASPPAAPSRLPSAQPLRPPQAPALSSGGTAPSRGAGPGIHPKR
jgi:hypothetical protein